MNRDRRSRRTARSSCTWAREVDPAGAASAVGSSICRPARACISPRSRDCWRFSPQPSTPLPAPPCVAESAKRPLGGPMVTSQRAGRGRHSPLRSAGSVPPRLGPAQPSGTRRPGSHVDPIEWRCNPWRRPGDHRRRSLRLLRRPVRRCLRREDHRRRHPLRKRTRSEPRSRRERVKSSHEQHRCPLSGAARQLTTYTRRSRP